MVALAGIRLTPTVRPHDVPPLGAALAGLAVAAAAVLLPQPVLDGGAGASGVAALVAVAQPPLGWTARSLLALVGGAGAALVAWSALFLLWGPGGWLDRGGADDVLVVRRADAHPDAPPRPPFRAGELDAAKAVPPTTPPAVPVERPVPADLDLPLSAFDPAAIPEQPMEPVRALPPLPRAALEPGERIETVELPAPTAGGPPPSIEALLDRLERRAARRAA